MSDLVSTSPTEAPAAQRQTDAGALGSGAITENYAPSPETDLLLAEAASAAAPRLLIQRLEVGRLQLLCDVHVSAGMAGLPVAVDAHRYGPFSFWLLCPNRVMQLSCPDLIAPSTIGVCQPGQACILHASLVTACMPQDIANACCVRVCSSRAVRFLSATEPFQNGTAD